MLQALAAAACTPTGKVPSPLKQRYMASFGDRMAPPASQTPGSSAKKKPKRSKESVDRTKDVNAMRFKLYKGYEYLIKWHPDCKDKLAPIFSANCRTDHHQF